MIGFTESQLSAWSGQLMWPFLRVLALFMAAPLFSHRSIPARVKVGLAMLVALVVAPLAAPGTLPALNDSASLKLVIQQLLVGVGIGFCVRLTVAAVELAGEVIGLQMGLSFAGFFDPAGGGQKNAMQSWMGVFAILLFLSINGHLLLIGAVTESFRLFPIQGAESVAAPFALDPKGLALLGGKMFYIGLSIALPFIVVLLAINLTLGVVSRVAPQMNIFGVGFAATFLAGLGGLRRLVLLYALYGRANRPTLRKRIRAFFALARAARGTQGRQNCQERPCVLESIGYGVRPEDSHHLDRQRQGVHGSTVCQPRAPTHG